MNKKRITSLLAIVFALSLVLSLNVATAAMPASEETFHSSNSRGLTFNIILSPAAVARAVEVVSETNLALIAYNRAYIVFGDANMVKDGDGEILGDGLTKGVNFYILVWDNQRSGFSLLHLAGLSTNTQGITYFADHGLVDLDGLTALDLTSQASRKTKIDSDGNKTVVKDDWEFSGLKGEVTLSIKYLRQEPIYFPLSDLDSHYQDNYLGIRYFANPGTLLELSRRATVYPADVQNINLSFAFEDTRVSEIFGDTANVIEEVIEATTENLLELVFY